MTKEEIIKFVREGLSALGSYSPAFEILIEGMAEVAMVRAKAFDLLQRDGIIQEEESREGAIRRRYHPAWSVFIEANKELRAMLTDLEMTVRSAKFTSGDELDKLNIKLQQIYDEVTRTKRSPSAQKRRGRPPKKQKD